MKSTQLDARLRSAALLVRQGAVFADVGTDHAHLPIFLLKAGVIGRAVLSDINEGPLLSAKENAEANGLSDRVELVLTDGVRGLGGKGITDYAICGMGGELIADIIASGEHLFDTGVRLILQPMTRQAHLRRELCRLGFEILEERYSFADGRYYLTMLVEYCGESSEIDDITAELGFSYAEETAAEYVGYLTAKLASYTSQIAGKRRGGVDASGDERIAGAIQKMISSVKEKDL